MSIVSIDRGLMSLGDSMAYLEYKGQATSQHTQPVVFGDHFSQGAQRLGDHSAVPQSLPYRVAARPCHVHGLGRLHLVYDLVPGISLGVLV